MIFNKHSELEGRHAILSPSKHYWLGYDDDALIKSYISSFATDIGTLVHEYASDRIKYRLPLDLENEEAKNGVNDCIGYKMDSEVILKYSDLCFGTADAIGVRRNWLRIFDLKTGVSPASMDQLLCYAGLFFMEYKRDYHPDTMKVELRIYQNQEVQILSPTLDDIKTVMKKIAHGNAVLNKNMMEGI